MRLADDITAASVVGAGTNAIGAAGMALGPF